MRTNRSSKAARIAMAGIALIAISSFGADVSHFNGSGGFASAQYNDLFTAANIQVYQNGQGQNAVNYLYLLTSTCSYSTTGYACSGTVLSGAIASADFAVNGRNATLNTNGSQLVGVQFTYGCDGIAGCYYNETPLTGGSLSMSWKQNTEATYQSTGTQIQTFANTKSTVTGTEQFVTASFSGTLLGLPVSATTGGSIGSTKNIAITVTKN